MTIMRLHPDVRLPLAPGAYRLDVRQDLDDDVTSNQPLPARRHHLVIDVPRLSMNGTEVFSVSPPPNSVGPYAGRLAQIVLRRRALPWARSGQEGPPWLALVVLTDGEGTLRTGVTARDAYSDGVYDELDEPPPADARADTLEVVQSVLDRTFPAEDELPLTAHVRQVENADTEYADEDGWVSVVLANRLPLPGMRYRAYLISVEGQVDRQVDGQRRGLPAPGRVAVDHVDLSWALADLVVEVIETRGTASLSTELAELALVHSETGAVDRNGLGSDLLRLVRSREAEARVHTTRRGEVRTGEVLLDDGAATVRADLAGLEAEGTRRPNAHLAATARLGVHDLYAAALAEVADETRYRFPVLAHWEFECSDDGRDFSGYMSRLDVGMIGATSANRFERRAAEGAGTDRGERSSHDTPMRATEVAATGHVGLDHTDRAGTRRRSWFRGPFVPSPVTRAEPGQPAHVADQLLALTEDRRWDTSYAAAFEVGRLLAMSDLQFLQALRSYARAGFVQRRRRRFHGEELARLAGFDALADPARLARLADELRRIVDRALVPGGLGVDPLVAVGQPLPVQDGPLVQPGEVVETLAAGLALESAAVAETLAVGPSLTTPSPAEGGFASFEDLVAGGVPRDAVQTNADAVASRVEAVRRLVEAAGSAGEAAGSLVEILEEEP